MSQFAAMVQADMRLVLLKVLAEDAAYCHNEYVLKGALQALGHTVSQDRLHTELPWLAEQGLIVTKDTAGVVVVKLSRRGLDVANGAATVPGVKRPEPEDSI